MIVARARYQASLTPMPAAAKMWQQALFFSVPSITLLIALVMEQALRLPTPLGLLAPPWVLLTTFYWLGHRPQALSAPLLLIFGVLYDILRAWPILGVTALTLLVLLQILRPLDHWLRTQTFRWVWGLAVIIVLAAQIVSQIMLWIFAARMVQPFLWLWAVCSAAGLYPLLSWLLQQVQRHTVFRKRTA